MYAVNVNVSMNTPAAYRTEAVCEPLLSTYIIQARSIASHQSYQSYWLSTKAHSTPYKSSQPHSAARPTVDLLRGKAHPDRYPNGGVPGTRIGGRREEGSTLHHPTGCHPVGVSSDTYPHRLASVTCRPNHTETNASLACRHGRGPLGGGVLRGGPRPQPPPAHTR